MSGAPGATASSSGSTCAASVGSDPIWQEEEVPVLRSPLVQALGTGVICFLGLQGRNWERRDGGLQRQHQRGSPGKWGHPETEIWGYLWALRLGPRPAGRSEPLTLQGLATRQSFQGAPLSSLLRQPPLSPRHTAPSFEIQVAQLWVTESRKWSILALWGAGPLGVLGLPFLWHTNSPLHLVELVFLEPIYLCVNVIAQVHTVPCFKSGVLGTSLVVQWLRLHASTVGSLGSILGWGTKIPHAINFFFKWGVTVIWGWLILLIREGNGTPLQYSCLENPMDGGAW